MEETKTVDELIKEKGKLERIIADDINIFLRDNPDITNIEIITNIYEYPTGCSYHKDVSIYIKLTM